MQAVGLSGVVHHLTCHGGLLSAGIAPAVVFVGTDFRTLHRESQQPIYGYFSGY